MRISKRQLRRIIKEEKARLLERRDKHAPFWPAKGSKQAATDWLGKAQGRPFMGVGSLNHMFQTADQAARGVAEDNYHPDNQRFGPKVEVPVDEPIDWSLYAGHPSLSKNPAPKPPYDVSPASNTGVGYVADDSPVADVENKKAIAAGIEEPDDEDFEVGRDEYKIEGKNRMKITKRQLRRIIKEELQEDANAEQYELQNNAKIQQAIYDLEDRVMPVLYGTDLEPMVNSLHKAMYRKVSGR